ncbi:DNA internalization-related competence protein ComEC/Rec2 [Mobilitalea sibirica]|uniref:DNA internalization-related competence protein ComEC/Rec2 n=2 Tax=Mobilitalea sibirica TaxID=1462919 RepID=A0A8J7KWE6_9FIRM|nr:DNA internalization-related competence protein ComEC/Rec2 [Mobilitalea sibirica]
MFRIKNPQVKQTDYFLWSIPVLLLIGFYSMGIHMQRPDLDTVFEEKISCKVNGQISMVVKKQWGKVLYISNNTVYLSEEKPYLCENIIVYSSDDLEYQVGNNITVYGQIEKFSKASNPGQFNEQLYYQIQNIDYKLKAERIFIVDTESSIFHKVLDGIKQRFSTVYHTLLSEKEAGVITAMILGDKYLIDDELKELYQENGIAHILAISGLHVTLIGLSVYHLLRKLKSGLIPATIITIVFIYCYGVLTSFSVSTNRAVVMLTILLMARIFGKTYDMLSAISLSALLILLQNPMQLFHVGFLLSFGAVLGISILLPAMNTLLYSNVITKKSPIHNIKKTISSGILLSFCAQVMTLPVILLFYYQLPVYSILINLIIIPCMSILVIGSLAAGIAGVFFMPVGVFLIGGTYYLLKLYEGVCSIGSRLPGNLLTVGKPDVIRIWIYYIVILIFLLLVKRKQMKHLILIPFLAVFILILPKGNAGLEITLLEVGQGEAIFMETKSGTTYLIDGGSSSIKKVGTYRIQPFLLSKGVDLLDYAIITHTDKDHISGLRELLEGKKIAIMNLILPYQTSKDDAYLELEALAAKKGVKVSYIKAGDFIQDDKVMIRCLHPAYDYIGTSANAYSTVLSINYGEFDLLLTGDLEQDGEKLLIDRLNAKNMIKSTGKDNKSMEQEIVANDRMVTDYDVLKVAHHGSRNSTSGELLKIIQPEYALISCGKGNSYGHPHDEVLERLKETKTQVKITYESGAIIIKTDGKRMEISDYIKE